MGLQIVDKLIANNKKWAEETNRNSPGFFDKLAKQQHPEMLWIGCADSRVPANTIAGVMPGEVFVHRNVANLVVNTDFNCLSVMQYAVEVLKVKYVIVCGHYNCGGVKAALDGKQFGLIDNWLANIRDVYKEHKEEIYKLDSYDERFDRLCELNVRQQVYNVCHTTIVQNAWARGQELTVCGVIYDVADGLLKDLDVVVNSKELLNEVYLVDK